MKNKSDTNFSWKIRKYREGDEHYIIELLDLAFGNWKGINLTKQQSLAYWEWWYKQNPAGPSVIWIAEHNNKVIGHYAIVPMKMKLGTIYLTGSFSSDAATHPDHQGKRILSSLLNKCYHDAANNNIPLTYGFANINLGPTYKRYEWRGQICSIVNMIKVVNWQTLLSRYIHNNSLIRMASYCMEKIRKSQYEINKDLEIKQIRYFDESINILWEDISKQFKIIVKRDQKYLNWRYVDHPLNKYAIFTAVKNDKILGYCVLGKNRMHNMNRGQILDILGSQNHFNVIDSLLKVAYAYFKEHDIDYVSCRMSEKNQYKKVFRRAGFIMDPRQKTALKASINLPGIVIDRKEFYSQALTFSQNSFLKEKENWFMMSGESSWF